MTGLLVDQDIDRAIEIASGGYLLAQDSVVTTASSAELRASDDVRRSVLGL